ncbi:MAG TPA: SsrA-binding protein SmpB [Bacilli bacterium]|nr:SsrA-binding protein SmpB [Bacilli bacterium]
MEERNVVARNKKANHEYFILDTLECGISLTGTEIKSIRQSKVSIQDAYCQVRNNQLIIFNMHIAQYDKGNIFNHKEDRDRILLAHKMEIKRWGSKVAIDGLTLIPLSVYITAGRAKVEIGLCKGKRQYDKREDLKKKDVQKEMLKTNKSRW